MVYAFNGFTIQWAPLNGIMDNGINWLMGPNLYHLTNPQITISYLKYSSFAF